MIRSALLTLAAAFAVPVAPPGARAEEKPDASAGKDAKEKAQEATRLPPPPPPRVEWKSEYSRGRHYVPIAQVAEYYGLSAPPPSTESAVMSRDGLRLEVKRGERRLKLNQWTFYFSYSPIRLKEQLMISAFDVRNVLDPILQPGARRDPAILRTVILDPAGGGDSAGAKSANIDEKSLTLAVAKYMRDFLRQAGFEVVMTREDDKAVGSAMRADIANRVEGEAIFVSLAAGSNSSSSVHGIECSTFPPAGTPATAEPDTADIPRTFYTGNISDRESLALATTLQSSSVQATKAVDRGIRRTRTDELRDVRMPAVMFRTGYLSNRAEAAKLATEDYQVRLAAAMVQGIRRYADFLRRGMEERMEEELKRPMRFGDVRLNLAEGPDPNGTEQVDIRLPVIAAEHVTIDRSRVEVQVYAFESVNDTEVDMSTADPPEVTWLSVLPDWKAVNTEMLEVTFKRPAFTKEEEKAYGRREFYGYVARLIYDGQVMDEISSPTNLHRALYYFTSVFPRR